MAEGDLISAGCCLGIPRGWAGSGGSVVWDPRGDITMLAQGVRGTQEKPGRCCWPAVGRCGGSSWAGICSRGSLTKAQESLSV